MEDSELYQALLKIVRDSRLPQGMEKLVALAHAADPYDEAVKVCRRFNWTGLGNLFTQKLGKLLDRKKLKPRHTGLILVLDETNFACGAGIRVEAGVAARENDDYEWSAVPEVELGEIRLPPLERLYEKIDAEWAWGIVVLYGFTGLALQHAMTQLGRKRFLKGAEFRRTLWGSHEGDPVFEFGDITTTEFIPHLRYDETRAEGEAVPELECPWGEDEALATGKAHDWLRLQSAACLARLRGWRTASDLQQIANDFLRCGRKADARRVAKLMAELAACVKRPEDRAACWRFACRAFETTGDIQNAKAAERQGKEAAALIKDEQERERWLNEYPWSSDLAQGGMAISARDRIYGLLSKVEMSMRPETRDACGQLFDQLVDDAESQLRALLKWHEFLAFNYSQLLGIAVWLGEPARVARLLSIKTDHASGGAIKARAMLRMGMRKEGLAFARRSIAAQRRSLARKGTQDRVWRFVNTMPDLLEALRQWGDHEEFLAETKSYLREAFRRQRDPGDRVRRVAEAAKLYIRAGCRAEFDDCVRRIREFGPKITDRERRGLDKYQLIECYQEAGDWDAALEVARSTHPPETAEVEFDMHLARKDWKRLFHNIRARKSPQERTEKYHVVAQQLAPQLGNGCLFR